LHRFVTFLKKDRCGAVAKRGECEGTPHGRWSKVAVEENGRPKNSFVSVLYGEVWLAFLVPA
jgi:hypothetical protein